MGKRDASEVNAAGGAAVAAEQGQERNTRPKPNSGSSSTSPLETVINPALLSPASRDSLRAAYATSSPYLHCVFEDPFQPQLLVSVRDEIINNIEATYKETDLFKVFQTGDLGNLARLDKDAAAKLPSLMALKFALYSDQFRAFIREVTGCGELSDKIDCSCNVYADGGHLLCHDDVIGTRRVSWIIYLTDPEHPWRAEDGGALELYPCVQGEPHTPDVVPTRVLLPTFNTMAMFTVQPGKSFHAVQEVFTSDKPRMSISGWYHAPHEPHDAAQASLQQLQTLRAGADLSDRSKYQPFVGGDGGRLPGSGEVAMSDEDLALLVKFVNPIYLSEESWPKMQAKFAEDGSIQLHNFLKRELADRILRQLMAEDRRDYVGAGGRLCRPSYEAGVGRGWEAVGPPHKQRYLRYTGNATEGEEGCGALLAQVRDGLFASGAFARLLRKFTTLGMVGQLSEVRRFRAGLDYTVAHYGVLTRDPRLDVVLCFVDAGTGDGESTAGGSGQEAGGRGKEAVKGKGKGKAKLGKLGARGRKGGKEAEGEEVEGKEGCSGGAEGAAEGTEAAEGRQAAAADKAAAWDAGEVGGFEAYLLAEDEAGTSGGAAADTYRVDAEESGVLNVSAACNSLSLVLRDEGLMRFVKYVSYAAPSSRWDVAMECLPEDDSDDDDEEGDKETNGA